MQQRPETSPVNEYDLARENMVTAYATGDADKRAPLNDFFDLMVGVAASGDEDMAKALLVYAASFIARGVELPPGFCRVLPSALRGAASGRKAFQVIAGTVGKRGNRIDSKKSGLICFRYLQLVEEGSSTMDAEAQVGAEVGLTEDRINQIIDEQLRGPARRGKELIERADALLAK